MLQAQREQGPCVDVLRTREPILATGDQLEQRWGEVGSAIRDAGFTTVHSYPMRWRGQTLGSLSAFTTEVGAPSTDAAALGQLFADLVTPVVVQTGVSAMTRCTRACMRQ